MRSDGILAKIFGWLDDHHFLVILPVIGILASIGVFVWSETRTLPDPEPISPDAQTGDYCSIDIQLLTRWVMKVTGEESQCYYLAIDTKDDSYIVSMNDTQFEGFADIVAFTYSETTELPEPKQIAGIVKTMEPEDMESLADALGLTAEEYSEMMGSIFLNLKHDPNTNIVGTFIWVLGFSVLILLFKLIAFCEERSERKKRAKAGQ